MKMIDKVKNYCKENKLLISMFILIFIVVTMPIFQKNMNVADDYLFHFSRIQSITDSLEKGIFPVKIHYPMACSCGYGTGFFYPNLFLYIPAIINLFIHNVSISYKCFIAIFVVGLFFMSYLSLKSVFKDKKIALLGTTLIMLSNGLMLNLYDRTALGELLGFFFIIPIICGLYNFVYDKFDKPYLIAIGFIGVLNAHLITTVICIIFAILYALFNIKKILENSKNILKLIVVAIIVLMITAFFWAPMLEQLTSQTFKLSDSWTVIKNDEFTAMDLFGTGRYSLGMILTISVPLLVYGLFDKKIEKKYKLFGAFALGTMFLMIFSPFWNLTNDYTNLIQFKWRLLGITTILTCISCAYLVYYYAKEQKFKLEYMFIVISIFAFSNAITNINRIIDSHDTYSNEYISTILYTVPESIGGGQEYLPQNLEYSRLLIEQNIATTDSEMKLPVIKDGLVASVNLLDEYHCKFLEIPFVYYEGYVANIISPEGIITSLDVEETNDGLVKVIIPNELVGNVMVWYNGTSIQKISYIVSLGTLCLVILTYVICIIRNKLKEKRK